MTVSLTRTVTFSAHHRFHVPDWSDDENRAAFGALGAAPGHGHTYRCSATVSGPLGADGTIMDLSVLDGILGEEVVDVIDGRHLNLVVPEFAYGKLLPTCEAMAAYLFPRLARRLPAGVHLDRVRLAEDATLYADCTGPADPETRR
ncbi:MAG: 6-carboxytetrahydropterin synthase [Gemmatimonadales bacterium]|jgi:6-pyruvoyltetrahydropterin/6-carboxytetrahydropterin synthase